MKINVTMEIEMTEGRAIGIVADEDLLVRRITITTKVKDSMGGIIGGTITNHSFFSPGGLTSEFELSESFARTVDRLAAEIAHNLTLAKKDPSFYSTCEWEYNWCINGVAEFTAGCYKDRPEHERKFRYPMAYAGEKQSHPYSCPVCGKKIFLK